jgi:dimethylhistidine N-methyltransferase
MRHTHPAIEVRPIEADFLSPLTLPASIFGLGRLGFFAGSTIGNLEPQSAMEFLRGVRRTLGPGAALLVGVDLPKDPSILVPAYNDRAGVTAAFNLNILARLNRDAGADFCTDDFIHRAIWNSDKSRIEMHLVSRRRQRVRLGGQTIGFERDETIHTENSYKHAVPRFQDMARQSGWQPASVWTDKAQWFSLHLLVDGQAA